MDFSTLIIWLQKAIIFGSFIMLAALGEMLTEKVGNLNLGTPGTMCVGASAAAVSLFAYESAGGTSSLVIILLSVLVSFFAAAFMGLIYSFFTTSLRINQNVIGLVLTITGTGLAKFLSDCFIISETGNVRLDASYRVFTAKIPGLSSSLGIVSDLVFNYGFMFYVILAIVILTAVYFSKTRMGLSLRSVGENPATADAAGINVTLHKYLATCIGSGMTGLAGAVCVLEFKEGAWNTANVPDIEAVGWLAVALVIFAMWKPFNLFWAAPVFGIFYWCYQYLTMMNTYVTRMFPYIVTIIVLIITSVRNKKENQGPQSLGLTYFREDR